jgi:acyl-CoA reductase-like NAD-dependent aldehyde dehydrogenase
MKVHRMSTMAAVQTMTIGGQPEPAASTFGVINPATGAVFAEAPECTAGQLDAAMAAASEAFVTWKTDEGFRRDCLRRAADVMAAASGRIGPLLTAEQGKPLRMAAGEAHAAAVWFRYYAELPNVRQVIRDDEKAMVEAVRRPLGVVAAIAPWNAPVVVAGFKIAPAMLAGNTVVLKPSPFTPLSTLLMGELLRDVFPPGVLNVVSGGDALGRMMTEHPVPNKISFTGSVATGKAISLSAAPDLKHLTLELGGNDAAIVLDDADPTEVGQKLFWKAFQNTGQICAAVKRIYVHEKLAAGVIETLTEMARTVVVGDGMEEGTELGPINNKPQFDRVTELVDDALRAGARATVGGKALGGAGYFFAPTVLVDLAEGVRIVDEEQFGPAVPVITYRDVDDAIARANATTYGLSGSVWTGDPERGVAVAERLECGTSLVNAHSELGPDQPLVGAKWSGIGAENGHWGLDGMTQLQVRYTAKS